MLSKELVNHLSLGATVLTPTQRLALKISQAFNQTLSLERPAWESPLVFSLQDWCLALWEQNESSGKIRQQLLNRQQSLLRFEEIIGEFCKEKLLQIGTTAKMAYQAWELLHQWLMLEDRKFTPENKEEETFLEWIKIYQEWLDQNQLLDNAQLVKTLLPLLNQTEKKTIILYGFEDLAPIYVHLFETLTEIGWSILSLEPPSVKDNTQWCFAFGSQTEEYQAAASWAKKHFLAGNQQIAIVVPELLQTRTQIEKILCEIFDPLSICHPNPEINPYFNISAAQPLANYPLMQALGALLQLGLPVFSIKDYAYALNSCFAFAFEEEKYARNQHVSYLKTFLSEKITLKGCLLALETTNSLETLHGWREILTKIQHLQESAPKKNMNAWADHFLSLIACVGWPGSRPLNSIEHQVMKRGVALIQELSYFDQIIEKPSYGKVLSLLQKLANNIPFQPENKKAPIQILGVLEAAGQQFDHLWVTGVHNEAWPSMTKSNPFIPLALQREHQIPHATAEREYDYCLKVTQRLKSAASEVIFSYPQKEKERALELSELINLIPTAFDRIDYDEEESAITRCENLFPTGNNLETYLDEKAPALSFPHAIKANAASLAYMAACPFKAFAALRLNAKHEKWPSLWLQAKERGIILHRVLEAFWQEYKTQAMIKASPSETISLKLKELIAKNLKPFMHEEASQIYFEAEQITLFEILVLYLDAEKTRSFFRVVETETKAHLPLGGLDFHLRFDRIDETAENQLILIDYKTGQFSLNEMWGERPHAPQLPLYYLASIEKRPAGLMAIKLQSKGCKFEGISEDALGIEGVSPLTGELTWLDLAGYWQSQLLSLVEKFVQGEATVSPLDGQNTCQYCEYHSLCRVNERVNR